MTKDEQRLAIAEACGYEVIHLDYDSLTPEPGLTQGPDNIWRSPSANKWLTELEEQEVHCVGRYFVKLSSKKIFSPEPRPDGGVNGPRSFDYTNDLNAMHEAEKVLTPSQRCEFGEYLAIKLGYDEDYYEGWCLSTCDFFTLAHATAEQRAEAFLKAIGKWKD